MAARYTVEERFWAKVDKDGPAPLERPDLGPCWIWTAYVGEWGYGKFQPVENQAPVQAHRFAYELLVGPIPDGLGLDHLCRVRPCVNPTHVEPVTQAENNARGSGVMAQNLAKSHCKHGHEFTPENIIRKPSHPTWRICRACARGA